MCVFNQKKIIPKKYRRGSEVGEAPGARPCPAPAPGFAFAAPRPPREAETHQISCPGGKKKSFFYAHVCENTPKVR